MELLRVAEKAPVSLSEFCTMPPFSHDPVFPSETRCPACDHRLPSPKPGPCAFEGWQENASSQGEVPALGPPSAGIPAQTPQKTGGGGKTAPCFFTTGSCFRKTGSTSQKTAPCFFTTGGCFRKIGSISQKTGRCFSTTGSCFFISGDGFSCSCAGSPRFTEPSSHIRPPLSHPPMHSFSARGRRGNGLHSSGAKGASTSGLASEEPPRCPGNGWRRLSGLDSGSFASRDQPPPSLIAATSRARRACQKVCVEG